MIGFPYAEYRWLKKRMMAESSGVYQNGKVIKEDKEVVHYNYEDLCEIANIAPIKYA